VHERSAQTRRHGLALPIGGQRTSAAAAAAAASLTRSSSSNLNTAAWLRLGLLLPLLLLPERP
jgi:hypothetical protein